MPKKTALPSQKVIEYFTKLMGDRRASAYRRDQAAKQLARLCQAEAKRLRAAEERPASSGPSAPAQPKQGKKAERQDRAKVAQKGTEWDGLIQ
jgi:hypothetical protein